jgi:hypothetical protein
MLDDREREMLLDIENGLIAEDPRWSTAFSTCARRVRRQRTFELVFHVVALLASAALTMLMVVSQAPLPAMFFASVTVLLIWLVHRLRHTPTVDTGGGPADAPPSDRGPVIG